MIDVVAGVIVRDGKILIARRGPGSHLEGYWEFPGGKVEKGESPEQTLERELKEELAIDTKTEKFIAESIYDYGVKKIRLLAYWSRYLSGEISLVNHDQIRWVNVSVLEDCYLAPADRPITKFLIKELNSKYTILHDNYGLLRKI